MKGRNNLSLAVSFKDLLVAFFFPECREVKPFLEDIEVVKDVWEEEVQKRPQLSKVVLERGAGKQEAVGRDVRFQFADELAIEVFDTVSLILKNC